MKLNEISENISHTSKRLRDIERNKGVKPGTDEWFKLWFSLPYLRESAELGEGYKIQLERDPDMYVLHILDTKTGKRTEVRGKSGYETGNYDPEDPLHQLLDKIGKASNISDLINGEVTGINVKHPDGERAKKATDVAFNEALNDPYPIRWSIQNDKQWYGHAKEDNPHDQIGISIKVVNDGEWDINFSVNDTKQKTGGGDQFKIFATVKTAIQEWWNWASKNANVDRITFSAEKIAEESRSRLYQRFAKQFADAIGYNLNVKSGTNYSTFSIEKPTVEENLTEALDNPYPYKWVDQSNHDWYAVAPLPSGLDLRIRLEKDRDDIWDIEFLLGRTLKATGTGDQYRIFATVVKAVTEWTEWLFSSNQPVKAIHFSAIKDDEQDTGRARLYDRFAKRLASGIGFDYENLDKGHMTKFILSNPNYKKVDENFAFNESVSGEEMLKMFHNMHHDAGMNPDMDEWVKSQEWGIDTIDSKDIVDFEELFDYDDPFDRIIDVDEQHVKSYMAAIQAGRKLDPVILGPKHSDGKYSIVDGNHRALAYAALDMPIPAYMPMGKVDENFADGKKPGRKGLAKRSGVDCSKSETELRKIAKRSSGEKQRMAHWCANMKAGKKK